MKRQSMFKKTMISKSVALSFLMLAAGQAHALTTVNLCAGETTKTLPGGAQVKMWGYGTDNGSPGCDTASVPGPQLTLPVGETELTVNLRNTLDDAVSVIIPGLVGTTGSTPVFFTDGTGRNRVRSLATETATNATGVYSFTAKPGTYLYQSGTHPAVQVQMGLYGASKQDAATGEAYPGVTYDSDIVMLYSEIDPAMHDAIAGTADELTAPTYGTTGPTSTIDYKARYFLVNGEPFSGAPTPAGDIGDRILIRFLNAGLESHVPVLQGQHMDVIAEYGNTYPFARNQYSILLAAGKTKDAIFTPASGGDYPLYDRRLRLTNSDQPGSAGLMSILNVTEPVVVDPATAVADADTTPEDTAVIIPVIGNDTNAAAGSVEIASQPTNGNAVTDGDNVTYTPNADYNGLDAFSYTVRNTNGDISNVAVVSVTVDPVNDAPAASDDAYNVTVNSVTDLDVQANDSDVDMDSLTTSIITPPTSGIAGVNPNGSISYTAGGLAGNDSLTYEVSDGILTSQATVNITVSAAANQPPVAVDDYASVQRNTGASNNFATIIVLANDTDSDGTLNPATVSVTVNPNNGIAVVNIDGSITYTPKAGFRGADAFAYTVSDDGGAVSNAATVRVNVVK